MPGVLELLEFIEDNQMTKSQVWPGRIHAELHLQGFSVGKFFRQFFFADDNFGIG